MSGLFRRLRRDRDAYPESASANGDFAKDRPYPSPGTYTDGHGHEEATAILEPAQPAPEDLDSIVGEPPTTRRRGRLRRRLRHLRRVREVLMRDLGGFVFELHRSGSDGGHSEVVEEKLRRLASVDAELRELEGLLDDRRPLVVRESGIGGACPQCGELFGSEARYCWACGTPVAAGAGHVPELLAAHGSDPTRESPAIDAPAPDADPQESGQRPEPAPDEAGDAREWHHDPGERP